MTVNGWVLPTPRAQGPNGDAISVDGDAKQHLGYNYGIWPSKVGISTPTTMILLWLDKPQKLLALHIQVGISRKPTRLDGKVKRVEVGLKKRLVYLWLEVNM